MIKLSPSRMIFVASIALFSLPGCDFEDQEPNAAAPGAVPGAATAGHRNPQMGFPAPGQTDFMPDGTGAGSTQPKPGSPGTGQPGAIDPACAQLPKGDACTECLKGDCCATLLKCQADKACSCILNCVTSEPDNILGCGLSKGCGLPDSSFLTELQSCSKGCVDAKICKIPSLPGAGGGIPGLPGGIPGLPGGIPGLPGGIPGLPGTTPGGDAPNPPQ